jgi:amino acid adenylation domain-containing protein
VHATVRSRSESELLGDVRLIDDAGRTRLSCDGLRLRTIDAPGADTNVNELLYQLWWEELPATERDTFEPRAIASAVAPRAAALCQPLIECGYYQHGEEYLDRLARQFAAEAIRKLALSPGDLASPPDDLATRVGIVPRHRQLFARLLELSAKADGASRIDPSDATAATMRGCETEWPLVVHCGSRLAEVVRGEVDALELLFGESKSLLTREYHESPIIRTYNEILADAVAVAVASNGGAHTTWLEVGGGTGALTTSVLRRLPGASFDYRFTDVSSSFFAPARERLGEQTGLTFSVLDIERDPAEQGHEVHRYDVVLASDVLHATRDLRESLRNARRLLRPGGLLALVELTRRPEWADIVFGLLDGWWRFRDHELRRHALVDADTWLQLLADEGFEDAAIVADAPRDGGTVHTAFLARAPHRDDASPTPRQWLVLADDGGLADAIVPALERTGDSTAVVRRPQAADLDAIVAATRAQSVMYCCGADAPGWDISTTDLMSFASAACGGILDLIRALERHGSAPDIWVVTAGAQHVEGSDESMRVAGAPLVGLGRVLANEQTGIRCRIVDVSGSPLLDADEVTALVRELKRDGPEEEIALRGTRRFARRIRPLLQPTGPVASTRVEVARDGTEFQLDQRTPGALDSLALREARPIVPGPGEIALSAVTFGLNFRDVLKALAMPPFAGTASDADARPQQECAGVVVACGPGVHGFRVGDEVIALASTPFGSHVAASVDMAIHKPAILSFEDAATVLVAFVTAQYALNDLARIRAGERVLIHSATGGVGLAAIQICRLAGAEIWATAGSPDKREYLRTLGIEHVFDSRSTAFADEVLERTRGEGVDVVLNSLAGEGIVRGLEILRPCGRFVEIGKRDIYANSMLGLHPFRKNLAFFGVDMGAPGVITRERLDLVARHHAAGTLQTHPRTVFDISEAEEAFRLMAQGKHIGKIVLSVGRDTYDVLALPSRTAIRAEATYLITGGLGGLGIAVAEWMVNRGARHLVLTSRTGVPRAHDANRLAMLARRANVVCRASDASREADVARLVAEIRHAMPPLRGIVHAAMVLDDAMLSDIDADRLERVLSPKVAGAWNLHRQTLGDPLDFFLLFSSIASVIGHPLQGNYAAANAFLDALSAERRSRGLPSVTVSWGALGEVGYVARHEAIREHIARLGLELMTPQEAMDCVERALDGEHAHVVATRSDWRLLANWNRMVAASHLDRRETKPGRERAGDADRAGGALIERLCAAAPAARLSILESSIRERVAHILGTTADRIDGERRLTDMGLDSLMAVELTTSIKLELGVQLGVAGILQGRSCGDVATAVLDRLDLSPAPSPSPESTAPPDNGFFPLSFEQRQFWFLDRLEPGNPAYNLTANARLTGELDEGALGKAVEDVIRRHDVLRARFDVLNGEPVQIIEANASFALPVVDFQSLSEREAEREIRRMAAEEVLRPFDLAHDPPLRATLLRLSAREHVVLLTAHHIAVDAQAMNLLVREIAEQYAAFRLGRPASPAPGVPRYTEYVHAQRERLAQHVIDTQLAYWKDRLASLPESLPLPTDHAHPIEGPPCAAHAHFALSAELSAKVADTSRRAGVTLFTTLLAATQALLSRYSSSDDIPIATPVSTRTDAASQALIGCCMNTVVLRGDLRGDPTFAELLARARDTTLGALANADVPFDDVVRAVSPSRPAGRTPLYQAMLVVHNLRLPPLSLPGLTIDPLPSDGGAASCDLMFVIDTGDELRGMLEYRTDLFDASTGARIVEQFRRLLESAVSDPERRVSELGMRSDAELRLVSETNDTAIAFAGPWCLYDLVAEQIACTPTAPAIVAASRVVTYAELGVMVARFSRTLRLKGVRRGDHVVVAANRSPEVVATTLAIAALGAVYVPIDPEQPRHRLALQLDAARPRLIATDAATRERFGSQGASLVVVDDSTDASEPLEGASGSAPDDVAYIIFTSGSTGEPKGVMVEHRAICNQIQWRNRAFAISAADAVLARTTLAFDPSIWELFGALAAGARLVLADPVSERDPAALIRLIREHGVTTLQTVPAFLDLLLDSPGIAECTSLARLFCGGDALSRELRERCMMRLPHAQLINLYGPTEAAIDATSWLCLPGDGADRTPIGRPVANASVYVRDEGGGEAAIGVPGEVYIGGAGVARGYLHDAAESARRFVHDPLVSGGRLFRTGDRARRRADGALEFLGRFDDQIKINGVRVELGEIEAALLAHPDVAEAAVIGPELIAFVASRGRTIVEADLRRLLADRLPSAMMPRQFVVVERLPRTVGGKTDRARLRALRDPRARSPGTIPPRTDAEHRVASIWRELLGLDSVGVGDDFFASGGHSLLAVRLVTRLEAEFGVSVPVASLFQEPTIAGLARLVAGSDRGNDVSERSSLVPLRAGGANTPLFLVHGLSGSVLPYMDLARLVNGDRPVLGLRALGLERGELPLRTIEEMATRYVEAVRSYRPSGPYLLAGWSMGGVIAVEMARQRRAEGAAVDLVALLDTVPTLRQPAPDTDFDRTVVLRRIVDGLGIDELPQDDDDAFWSLAPDDQLALLESRLRERVSKSGADDNATLRQLRVVRASLAALRMGRPRPVAVPIVVIGTEATTSLIGDDTLGWHNAGFTRVTTYTVPGDHDSMLRKPNCAALARLLDGLVAHRAVVAPRSVSV